MIVMSTAIFSSISIILDRNEGFLQGVLASPASRGAIVLGKLAGGSTLAVGQGVLFLTVASFLAWMGLAPPIMAPSSPLAWLGVLGMLFLMAVSLCSLGYAFAWRLDSIQGFHAIMSVLLFPMWLLSGAFFPIPETGWLAWVMRLNPLTYGVAGLRQAMTPGATGLTGLPSPLTCVTVTALFGLACTALDIWMTSRPSHRN
jgi:ABC-type polysaccharide/polyol phosphate export permease